MSEGSADLIIVFFSGSCKNNGFDDSAAGSGVWWGTQHPKNLAVRTPGKQTNICAELFGLLTVLEQIQQIDEKDTNNLDAFLIHTDRKYTFDCFTRYLPKWRVNNFCKPKKGPIENVELIRYITVLLDYVSLRHDVKLVFVPSDENRPARALAEQASNLDKVEDVIWSDCRRKTEEKLALTRAEIEHMKYEKAQTERKALEVLESSKKHNSKKEKKNAQEVPAIPLDNADEEQRERLKKDKKLKRKARDADIDRQQEIIIRVEEERTEKRTKRKHDTEETEMELKGNSVQPPRSEKKRSKKVAKVVVVLKIQVETKEKKGRRKEGREGKHRRHEQAQ
ncbi:ribonuclease H-like protein [Armillaria gallica]|uniref:ribonuclease H n=1 Tax=Armillaria gallica TaxID=47427 RepID=A0A2H3E9K1_ARMGA|nr:ribonuclease H-like protein [Armillaria gallica]